MENEIVISHEFELIAQAMSVTRGDLAKASRLGTVEHNAMSLRAIVKDNPEIRKRYHELLAEEMQEKGRHFIIIHCQTCRTTWLPQYKTGFI